MITDEMSPVISTDTYKGLCVIEQLAKDVYEARSNFTQLCAALDKLFVHFDALNPRS